jgi:isoquinoline 1-oxidoreductase beta subunit
MTTRRDFLTTVSAGGAGLLIGFRLPRRLSAAPSSSAGESELNAWIRIGTDDQVTLVVNESEMGQGVLTSLPMILGEELDVEWSKVRSEHALADPRYGNQGTGGSSSVRGDYASLRKAGAAARQMLIAAAAATWGIPAAECATEPGVVTHPKSGRRASYGRLAARAATLPPPADPPLKDPKDFRIIGKATKRLDTPAKVTGRAVFGIDVQVPGMLVAQVVHCPVFGGKLGRFDGAAALRVPGVRRVVQIPSGVAVVADDFWAAKKGRDALVVEWDPGAGGELSSASIAARLRELAPGGVTAIRAGDPDAALAAPARRLDAEYEVPYLAHATMEPMTCTVDVRADACEIWVPTQFPTSSRRLVGEITGLPLERVTLHTTFLGGGFGRRAQTDFLADALHASKAVGRPVKVIYTREDDMHAGWYRPVAYNAFSAALDADGWPTAWVHRIASPSILANMGPLRGGIDGTSVEGAQNLPYAIPNLLVSYARVDFPVSVWFWRSVGSSINGYVTECFLDELAHAGGKDPVELRRRLLTDHPRHRRVLDLAAEKAGWGTPLPGGRARGVALHESFGSIVAEVAEVSLGDGGVPRVHRVVCAVDCGQVVNPDTVVAQMESGIAYGLSAALYGEITIDHGRAVQSNFDTYPVLRIDQMPVVETHIVAEGDPMGGIGEPGTPPIAPALCNALLTLTGKPVRRLPIVREA